MKTLKLSLALLLLAGCSGSNTVTVSTRLGARSAAGATAGLKQGLSSAAATPAVSLERVRMVVRRVKLERETGGTELEVASGPFLLDVSGAGLAGTLTRQFQVDAPAGTYHELSFDIHELDGEATVTDPALQELKTLGASIVIDGTVDGAPFTFVTDVNEQQQFEGTFEVGSTTDNVTLNIDPAGWFTAADGTFLDPRQAANQDAIEVNVRRSIDVFEDDDSDGAEDDHGDGGHGSDDAADGGHG